MREQPWNQRNPSTQHFRKFQDLIDLHQLTLAWSATSPARHSLPFPELNWVLEKLQNSNLSLPEILDDTSPDDVLGRLEALLSLVHVRALENALAQTSAEQLGLLSQKAGQACAQRIWPRPDPEVATDLRGLWSATQSAPLFRNGALLLIRGTQHKLECEYLLNPHVHPLAEVRAQAPALIQQRLFWLQGFLSVLASESQLSVESTVSRDPSRPVWVWSLTPSSRERTP